MESMHKKRNPSQDCQKCNEKDISLLEHVQKVERLELKVVDIESDLKSTRLENQNMSKENEAFKKNYDEMSKVIGGQQRKITELMEKIKKKPIKIWQILKKSKL